MIEFLGTRLLASIPLDTDHINLAGLCGVSDARAEVFVDALIAAKEHAFID